MEDALAQSGTENPITAVLLNFRGYDTLLEMAVLTSALMGVWALGPAVKAGGFGTLFAVMAAVALLGVGVLAWLPAEPAPTPDVGGADPSPTPNPPLNPLLRPSTSRRAP